MSGLPDEAVEAMARALVKADGHEVDAVVAGQSLVERRRVAVERVLAALPAGVYVSDGQGNVTPHTEEQAIGVVGARLGILFPEWHPTNRRRVALVLLAALSATDTETR